METKHDSVLLHEAVDALSVTRDDVVVDGTIGGAGHFSLLMRSLGREGVLVGIDADGDAITRARAASGTLDVLPRTVLAHDNFRNLGRILDDATIQQIDKALFDLGWSSFHLSSGRGFSFQTSEPLYMTYGEPVGVETAADIVNTAPEETLADIFYTYGEERFSRQIAKSIVTIRKRTPLLTTDDLVAAVLAGTPSWYHHKRIHPATKVFQALRIAVNDELGALREGITTALHRLSPGGRIAVITFHSIEDRIVKHMFRDAAAEHEGTVVTRKPVVPSAAELKRNPRARSAKLRVFESAKTSVPSFSNLRSFMFA